MKSLDCFKNLLQENEILNVSIEVINSKLVERSLPGIVLLSSLLVIGIFGNGIVIVAYGARFRRGTNYRFYVLCLAILDIGNCAIGIPWCLVYLLKPVTFTEDILCRGGLFVSFFLSMIGSCCLVLIAFDRYRKICLPLKKQINHQNAKFSVLAILLISVLSTWFTPFLYEVNRLPLSSSNVTGYKCYLAKNPIANTIAKGYYFVLAFAFTVFSTTLTVLYYLIMKKVHIHFEIFRPRSFKKGSDDEKISNQHTRKTSRTFFLITAVYILTTLPHIVAGLVFHFVEDLECTMGPMTHGVFNFFYWIVYVNNVANPFIYGFSDDRFRRILTQTLTLAFLRTPKSLKKGKSSGSVSVSIENKVSTNVHENEIVKDDVSEHFADNSK